MRDFCRGESRNARSAAQIAFEYYLRTGRRGLELKFNPYHDPGDGRFAFAPGGGSGSVSVDLRTGAQRHGDGSITVPLDPPAPKPYREKKAVRIDNRIEPYVTAIGTDFAKATGKEMLVVSSRRAPEERASFMLAKIKRNRGKEYVDKTALAEILDVYDKGQAARISDKQITDSIGMIIERQVKAGRFISKHLKGEAIDVRINDLEPNEVKALRSAAIRHGGKVHYEGVPPHLHIQLYPE